MGFLSFGSKKDRMKKLIEEERFDEAMRLGLKDRKALDGLFELLDDPNPGIVGDALLLITNILREKPSVLKGQMNPETFRRLVSLMESRNPYVRENAMLLAYEAVKRFPELVSQNRKWIIDVISRGLREGSKDQKGFLLIVAGELGLSELRPLIEELVNVEDKVVLPFEGKKWVKLGDIAKETLERLA
ncbi:hypothetical protein [Thermococcus sp.]|uniref:hypothetical protein n=1 Tax=Thermococcus sp. TaxID=35749 RepID=UPI0026386FB0|nr:hypothetical protein [Thermococcus sp.]